MTTEIAILNKSAVALAADSAVTIRINGTEGDAHKVLNTANKLFSLSKFAPVGLMIYGTASIMDIPWETVVKMFREQLHDKTFPHLQDYASEFFAFLDKYPIPKDQEKHHVMSVSAGVFVDCFEQLREWVDKETTKPSSKPLKNNDIQKKLNELINEHYKQAKHLVDKKIFGVGQYNNVKKSYRTEILKLANDIFKGIQTTATAKNRLVAIASTASLLNIGRDRSGIVIAGFGDKDIFPSCHEHDVWSIIRGKSVWRKTRVDEISHKSTASIMPFAQSHDVHTFMTGLGPRLENFLRNTFNSMMTDALPESLIDEIDKEVKLSKAKKAKLLKLTKDLCSGANDRVFDDLKKKKKIDYIDPVVQATSFLNKAELAAMAETLVNLVSFRKQVTMEAETVGGPIDVAIISKGDGFVWIKRKYYFPNELNRPFYDKYLLETN